MPDYSSTYNVPTPTAEEVIRRAYLTQPHLRLAKDPDGSAIAAWSESQNRWCMVAGWTITGQWVSLEYEILINGEHPIKQADWSHVPNIGPTLPTQDSGLLREMGELSNRVFRESFPTDNATAEEVWRFSNRTNIPASLAARFMESLGYEPFKGFPLQRQR